MNVDSTTDPSSSSKRPAPPSSSSSSADKRPKLVLPAGELTTLNSNMDRKRWKWMVNEAEANNDLWPDLLSDVLGRLTLELASTDMKNKVIANLTFDHADKIVKSFDEDQLEAWKVGVRKGVKENDWTNLIERPELRIPNIAPVSSPEQEKATKDSWEHTYIGQAAEALWTHIGNHYKPRSDTVYAQFCSVVQSSGMGKSRTVDELGKEHFSIPINLRDEQSSGYPPADHEVRVFLTAGGTEVQSYLRALYFIDALFQHTDQTLKKEFDSPLGMEEVARQFRIRMTRGQTMNEHNEFRRQFYREVIEIAEKYPLVILTFDEAHTLTNREETDKATWSNFSVLRHVLRALCHFPLFTLFLSTTGKISRFTSPVQDTSKRIVKHDLTLIKPFTDLGFDTLAEKVDLGGGWNLERVTADAHMVYMGRPLFGSRYKAGDPKVRKDIVKFAVEKLLNAEFSTRDLTQDQMLACLSQRLPIEFNSTTYISQIAERRQVEGHMRVCLKIDAAFEGMVTVSPSEPLLSEAAYVIMSKESFHPLESFKSVVEGFAVHQGDRGEFLALLLLTLARDQAVGPPDEHGHPIHPKHRFFDFASFVCGHLFNSESPSISELKNLQTDFPNATMHFNHFVKLHDLKSINKNHLLLRMTRGAGVLCANTQASIDAINVFLRDGTKLSNDNFGLIFSQIKNDPHFTHIPKPELFESMNPYKLGVLDEGDAPVPLVRIFFALGAKTSSITVTRHATLPGYNAIVYDIWVSGLSPDFLKPIDRSQTVVWNGLLQASYGWKEIYKTETDVDKELRQSMNPSAADDDGHWSRWSQ
ncbi:hypothetical protein F5887DRAFT_1022029 [Amanita rubescens]|nr:hypothetical protein F5887DRAFT_1022029 [Amanita rubescens]